MVESRLCGLLAVGTLRTQADANHVLGGLVRGIGFFDDDCNTAVLGGVYADCLLIQFRNTCACSCS
jgi:hypothetical protein